MRCGCCMPGLQSASSRPDKLDSDAPDPAHHWRASSMRSRFILFCNPTRRDRLDPPDKTLLNSGAVAAASPQACEEARIWLAPALTDVVSLGVEIGRFRCGEHAALGCGLAG